MALGMSFCWIVCRPTILVQIDVSQQLWDGFPLDLVQTSRVTGGTVVQWLALLPRSKKVLGSILSWGLFCVEFEHSVWVPSRCSAFLPQSKDMQVATLNFLYV